MEIQEADLHGSVITPGKLSCGLKKNKKYKKWIDNSKVMNSLITGKTEGH